jgi:hypothetical protein
MEVSKMNILSAKDKSRTEIGSKDIGEFIQDMKGYGYSDFEIGNTGDITCKDKDGKTKFFIVLGQDIVPFNFG